MKEIFFAKNDLSNLEYSLNREVLRANVSNAYSCTTLPFCNTRKYHGLLIVPQPKIDNQNHALLSSLDETINQNKENKEEVKKAKQLVKSRNNQNKKHN